MKNIYLAKLITILDRKNTDKNHIKDIQIIEAEDLQKAIDIADAFFADKMKKSSTVDYVLVSDVLEKEAIVKDKYSMLIHLDASEKTYEYILRKNGEDFLMGDGYETMEEIHEFLNDLKNLLNNIELDD